MRKIMTAAAAMTAMLAAGPALAGVPVKKEGVQAAMQYLADCASAPARRAA